MSARLFPKKTNIPPRLRHWIKFFIAVLVLCSAYWGADGLSISTGGTARVIDGDTIELDTHRIRLYGMDAPEISQFCTLDVSPYACGHKAREALLNLIAGASVTCKERDIDRYNRIVAICFVRDVEINDWMVRQGYAVAYRRYADRYIDAEEEAKAAKRGLWQGRFEYPWDYRRHK